MKFQIGQVSFAINLRNTENGVAVFVNASGPIAGAELDVKVEYDPSVKQALFVNVHIETGG